MRLILTIKKPGNLLSVFLKREIDERQYAQIVTLLSDPDKWQVTRKPAMGFGSPSEVRKDNAHS